MYKLLALLIFIPNLLSAQSLLSIEGGLDISDFPTDNLQPSDEGVIRFNIKYKDFEGWNGTHWISLTTGLVRGIVKDIDGNEYETIVIGLQEWMAENLKSIRYRNGDLMAITTDGDDWANLATGGVSFVNGNSSNSADYGIFYNWFSTVDPRGICPAGWDVPTDAQWTQLFDFIGGTGSAGIKMKEKGFDHWTNNTVTALEDSSGFSGRGAGRRSGTGGYVGFGIEAWWWSKTELSTGFARDIRINGLGSSVIRSGFDKRDGNSVRCIKL